MSTPRVRWLAVHCHAIRCDANRGGSGDRGAQPGRTTRSGTGRSGAAAIGDESSTIAKANGSAPAPAAMPPASRSIGVAARPARRSAGRDVALCGLPQIRARRPDAIRLVKGSSALRLTALGCRRESELLLIRNRRTKFATESKKMVAGDWQGPIRASRGRSRSCRLRGRRPCGGLPGWSSSRAPPVPNAALRGGAPTLCSAAPGATPPARPRGAAGRSISGLPADVQRPRLARLARRRGARPVAGPRVVGGSRHPRSLTLPTSGSKRPMLRTARGLRRDP